MDFELGGPLHIYLESRFLPLSEQVIETATRVKALEEARALTFDRLPCQEQEKRIRKLEMWRSYLTGTVASIAAVVAIGGRESIGSFIRFWTSTSGPK